MYPNTTRGLAPKDAKKNFLRLSGSSPVRLKYGDFVVDGFVDNHAAVV